VTLAGHSMGGALAVLAAAARPELVQRLVLISPAGLPLQKPLLASAATFAGQVARRCYPLRELVPDVAAVLRAPRSALRLAQTVRGLDLSPELEAVRAARIPTAVIACGTDTLVTPAHCRALAERLGGTYRTVRHEDGHIWMLRGWQRLAQELAGGA
jgi:pimeloyl-ACP methyl ester carboxylesterase